MRRSRFIAIFVAALLMVALMGSTTALAAGFGAPSGCKAIATGSSTIKISWNRLSGAYLYSVHCSTDKSLVIYTVAAVLDNDVFSYTVKHLNPSQKYYFMVEAAPFNDEDPNSYSGVFSASTKPGIEAPADPKAVSVSSSKITVSWSAVPGATGYALYATNATSVSYGSYHLLKTVSSSVHSWSITGIAANTQRCYRVRALNARGEGAFSAVVSAWTRTKAPTSLRARALNAYSIKLTWKAVAGAEQYTVYRYDPVSKTYQELATVNAAASPAYTNNGLLKQTRYYYKVVSINSGGASAMSKAASAKTPA